MTLFELVGYLGQAFFFGRFLIQWWASEAAGRVVVPPVFWSMSLAGAVCTAIYAWSCEDLVFFAAPIINLFIYGRNLVLFRTGRNLRRGLLRPLGCGVVALVLLTLTTKVRLDAPMPWKLIGVTGQVLWTTRFPLQWWLSERLGRPTLPPVFYWVSWIGSITMLAYAIYTGDPIWILGYVIGPVLYGRGLMLSYRKEGIATTD